MSLKFIYVQYSYYIQMILFSFPQNDSNTIIYYYHYHYLKYINPGGNWCGIFRGFNYVVHAKLHSVTTNNCMWNSFAE